MKKLITLFLSLFFVFYNFKIHAQCSAGETEIEFYVSGVSGGWSDYVLLIESPNPTSSYLFNSAGSNIECILDGSCFAVTLVGNAILEIYQGGLLVSTPNNGDVICFPFANSLNGCTDSIADNYDSLATVDDGSCIYNNCNSINNFTYIGSIGSCCYYEYIDTTTWINANTLCLNNGGNLVSINTIQESDSLNLLLGNNNSGGNQHWLNLIDGSSFWQNGDPLLYTNYDASYNFVNGNYIFLQNNGFWDNSPNDGSESNDGIYPLMEICQSIACTITTMGVVNNVTCNGNADGSIIASATGGTGTYVYSLDGINYQNSNIFSSLISGTYTVYYQDANGCIETEQLFVNEPSEISLDTTVNNVSCNGLSDGQILITISGGTPNYAINLGGISVPLTTNNFTTPGLPSGNYPLEVTDVNGCSSGIINYTISEPSLIFSTDIVVSCDDYLWIDNNLYTSSNNSASYVLIAENGCDSVVNLNLTIVPDIVNTVYDTACGEYLFGGDILYLSGSYVDTFSAITNCDSIVNLELTIFEDSSVTFLTACDSVEWNGVWYYSDTTVTDTGFVTVNSFGGATVSSSGKEGNIWYFGANAGLDFNSGTPVPLANGQLYTFEGCASICDNNGDLLFYTDGVTVYNKNHNAMPNGSGLLGHPSSTQSAIIVKKPGSSTIYTLLTVDGYTGSGGGLNYSEVDISLDGGLGDVNFNKNINLIPYTLEKVTAIEHQNGTDFWIVSPENNTNIIHSFLLTSSGINMIPVLTNAQGVLNGVGYLKASPDGSKIALVNANGTQDVQLYNFDNSTGLLTYDFTISTLTNYPYGVEFSPNSSVLYVSEWSGASIWQFNLLAGSSSSIVNSAINIGSSGGTGGALQLGPNNKIYQAVGGGWGPSGLTHLPVVNNPDIVGVGCNFDLLGASLGTQQSIYGLPTFFSSIFNSPPLGCDSVATAIIDIKNSSSSYSQEIHCDSFTWILNGKTYYTSQIDTIQSVNLDGCQHIDSLDLTIYPKINASAIINNESCVNYSDGSIVLNISGGLGSFTYNWTGPASFVETTKDIFNLDPGVYNLTITDISSLCVKDTSFVIASGFDMQITTSISNVSCYDSSDGMIDIVPINLINPIYSWSDVNLSLEDRLNLIPGTYYVQIDDNNCFLRDTFEISQPDSLFMTALQTNTTCSSNNLGYISVQVYGGTPDYSYYWSNWDTDSLNDGLSPGIYNLSVYDNNNCNISNTFNILAYEINVLSSVNNIACYGDSSGSIDQTIFGGFSPYDYSWSNLTSTEDVFHLSAGAINCTITDYLGCSVIQSYTITEESSLQANEIVNSVSCFGGNDGSINLHITGGVNPYSIDWFNFDENNLFSGTYQYEITDANGCVFSDTVYVPQEDSLDISINVTDLGCPGDPNGEISVFIYSGGSPPYNFIWSGPNSYNSTQQDIDNLYAGLYTLQLNDANGCSFEYQITISEPIELSQYVDIEMSTYTLFNISCYGGNDGWITANPNGGYIPYDFLWSTGSQDNNITNLVSGNYTLTVTNGIGCQEDFVFNLSQPSEPLSATLSSLYDFNGFDVSCFNANDGGILVNASGGVAPYSYYWNNQTAEYIPGNNPHAFLQAGVYNLELIDNNGCSYFDAIVLDQPDLIQSQIIISPDTCEKSVGRVEVILSGGVSPFLYSWNYTDNLPVAENVVEGQYFLNFEDANSCIKKDTVLVENLVSPEVDFEIMSDYEKLYEQQESPIVFIDMTELIWQNVDSWYWDYGDGQIGYDSVSYHSYDNIGTYDVTLTVTTDYNCIDTLTKQVVIAQYDIHIPNAFTPNSGDDFNNGFRPYGIGIDEYTMKIYTRWGGLVFSTDNINEEWNGNYQNDKRECQIGIYIYYIQVKDIFGAIHKYEGQVNLIR